MKKIFAVAAALFILASPSAHALECMEPQLEIIAQKSDAVFKGHVVEIQRDYKKSGSDSFRFEKALVAVETPIRGDVTPGQEIEVIKKVWTLDDSHENWHETATNKKEGIFVLNHSEVGFSEKDEGLDPKAYYLGPCGILMWDFTPHNLVLVEQGRAAAQ